MAKNDIYHNFSFNSLLPFSLSNSIMQELHSLYYSSSKCVLLGRSNVGKSSFINSLTHTHGLSRVSKTPGKTRQNLIFSSRCKKFFFVDVPGYGFTNCNDSDRKYMTSCLNLCMSYALKGNFFYIFFIDCRRFTKMDKSIMQTVLSQGKPFVIIISKIDKVCIFDAIKIRYDIECYVNNYFRANNTHFFYFIVLFSYLYKKLIYHTQECLMYIHKNST